MSLRYAECFGQPVDSPKLGEAMKAQLCPFVGEKCSKNIRRTPSGSCALVSTDGLPVICCPKRLYANRYQTLREVSAMAFGPDLPFVLEKSEIPSSGSYLVPFGQKQGKEIRIPYSSDSGDQGKKKNFSIDWIVAKVSEDKKLESFIAIEVQTIDTTGNYQLPFYELAKEQAPDTLSEDDWAKAPEASSSNFNFENVNKRILPQLITKGHVLRREPLCEKGLFFVCPEEVLKRILERVGDLPPYPLQNGSITLVSYNLGKGDDGHGHRALEQVRTLTTTIDQLYMAFSSPKDLPDPGVYEKAIGKALKSRF